MGHSATFQFCSVNSALRCKITQRRNVLNHPGSTHVVHLSAGGAAVLEERVEDDLGGGRRRFRAVVERYQVGHR